MAEEKKGISKILADKGSKKLLVFAGVVVVGGVGYAYMGGGEPGVDSSLSNGPSVESALDPTTQSSPAYGNAIAEQNTQRAQQAAANGESALPTIINAGEPESPLVIPDGDPQILEIPADPEPIAEPEPIAVPEPEPTAFSSVQPASPTPQAAIPQNTGPQIDMGLVDRYTTQMDGMMQSLVPVPAQVAVVYNPDSEQAAATEFGGETAEQAMPMQAEEPEKEYKLPLPGTVFYGQLVSKATSDAPGPVIAKVLQGPYSGATLIGSFQVANEALVIQFNTMSLPKEGVSLPINAMAVDTKNIGTAMATDVDRHLLLKLGTTFVTSFIKGFGEAVTQSGSTTKENADTGTTETTNKEFSTKDMVWAGMAETADQSGEVLKEQFGNMPTTVEVDANTPIGILFL